MAIQAMKKLVIEEFGVSVKLVDNFVCGGVDDEFNCEVTVGASQLTEEGYVVEVEQILGHIRDAYKKDTFKASCEELVQGVVHVVAKDFANVTLIDAKVWNRTGWVEMTWKRGEHVIPEFPRKATASEKQRTQKAPQSRLSC